MSKNRYFSILETLEENKDNPSNPNDRILIVDGLNTFIRAFAANPVTNDDGIHVGGITRTLMSIGYAIKNIKPTRVIVCFDGKGGSQRRRKIFPDYKANRRVRSRLTRHGNHNTLEDESLSMKQQLMRCAQYMQQLPLTVLSVENIEADDSMAYISQQVYPNSQKFIMSTDRDFLQLVSDKVHIWSPTKKKFYFKETIMEEYGIPSHNFLLYRTIEGDASDNIPGIRGAGRKTIANRIPIITEDRTITIDEIIDFTEKNSKYKILKTISESKELLDMNYKLMQLNEVDISGSAKTKIMDTVRSPIQRLVKYEFQKMVLEDKINGSIKNPDLWLKQVFLPLDSYAGMTYDK